MAWIRGDAFGSVGYVLSLISKLPEGSRFTVRVHFDRREKGVKGDPDPETEAFMDAQYWDGDRLLFAQFINAIRELTMVTGAGKWKKGKEPKYSIVGPREWREDSEKPESKASVSERLHAFFFGG
ncbi:hypothetical protein [Glutamicibacter uratoxydans]|uniref:hypothetical protein n=1 Tax=Glutamicibacter uratoxydans TaxID=43667 RepID=UPI001C3F7AE7|nr:hypothetical protein [Glutamicibacter uratoxydans]